MQADERRFDERQDATKRSVVQTFGRKTKLRSFVDIQPSNIRTHLPLSQSATRSNEGEMSAYVSSLASRIDIASFLPSRTLAGRSAVFEDQPFL